ncbi:hypothetical protein K3495_g10288 [Podosphaera aphanis]|nr:hypothetical protein K3495_g10288 [Podosphaera aphanis]
MAIGVANLICSWQLFKKVFNLASLPNFKSGQRAQASPLRPNSPLIAMADREAQYSMESELGKFDGEDLATLDRSGDNHSNTDVIELSVDIKI